MQFAEWSSEAPTVQNRDKCGSYDFVTLARSAQRRTELLINHPSKLINSVFYCTGRLELLNLRGTGRLDISE